MRRLHQAFAFGGAPPHRRPGHATSLLATGRLVFDLVREFRGGAAVDFPSSAVPAIRSNFAGRLPQTSGRLILVAAGQQGSSRMLFMEASRENNTLVLSSAPWRLPFLSYLKVARDYESCAAHTYCETSCTTYRNHRRTVRRPTLRARIDALYINTAQESVLTIYTFIPPRPSVLNMEIDQSSPASSASFAKRRAASVALPAMRYTSTA